MSATKKYNLTVKVGTYEKNGETKGRYKTIGSLMEKEDGGKFILLDPYFNFTLLKPSEGFDSIIVSMMEPRDNAQQTTSSEE